VIDGRRARANCEESRKTDSSLIFMALDLFLAFLTPPGRETMVRPASGVLRAGFSLELAEFRHER
jgi:hypothetical protein